MHIQPRAKPLVAKGFRTDQPTEQGIELLVAAKKVLLDGFKLTQCGSIKLGQYNWLILPVTHGQIPNTRVF